MDELLCDFSQVLLQAPATGHSGLLTQSMAWAITDILYPPSLHAPVNYKACCDMQSMLDT